MDEASAKSHCVKHGSQLLSYEGGRVASVILPSGEEVAISVGTDTAKVYVMRSLSGSRVPRAIASEQLSKWDDRYTQSNALYQDVFREMILDGLLSSVSRFKSVADLQTAWSLIRNPIEIAVLELGYGSSGDATQQ